MRSDVRGSEADEASLAIGGKGVVGAIDSCGVSRFMATPVLVSAFCSCLMVLYKLRTRASLLLRRRSRAATLVLAPVTSVVASSVCANVRAPLETCTQTLARVFHVMSAHNIFRHKYGWLASCAFVSVVNAAF